MEAVSHVKVPNNIIPSLLVANVNMDIKKKKMAPVSDVENNILIILFHAVVNVKMEIQIDMVFASSVKVTKNGILNNISVIVRLVTGTKMVHVSNVKKTKNGILKLLVVIV